MPNPEFAGNVPRMRCETCKNWGRQELRPTFGTCMASLVQMKSVTDPTMAPIEVADMQVTTDLTVCSNWTAAE